MIIHFHGFRWNVTDLKVVLNFVNFNFQFSISISYSDLKIAIIIKRLYHMTFSCYFRYISNKHGLKYGKQYEYYIVITAFRVSATFQDTQVELIRHRLRNESRCQCFGLHCHFASKEDEDSDKLFHFKSGGCWPNTHMYLHPLWYTRARITQLMAIWVPLV